MRVIWRHFHVLELRDTLLSIGPFVVLTTLVCVILFAILNVTSAGTNDGRLRNKIHEAYANRNLGTENRLLNNKEIGANQGNDCLILSMAMNSHGTLIERSVSPFGRPAIETGIAGSQNSSIGSVCDRLGDIIVNGNEEGYAYVPYHRYIHGGRALAELIVPWLGVQTYRNFLLAANYLVLLAAAAISIFRACAVDRAAEDRSIDLALALFSVLLISVSGIQYFGMSLSTGPADLTVHAMFFALCWFGVLSASRKLYFFVISVSASLIIYFEFLTGQIPFALAILIFMPFFCLKRDEEISEALLRSILGSLFFCTICAGLLVGKFWLSTIVFGPEIWVDVLQQLIVRTSKGEFSLFDVIARLVYRTHHIAFGFTTLGLLYLLGAFVVFGHCVLRDFSGSRDFVVARACGILAGITSLLIWYVAFSSHSAIHSWFMIRPIGLFAALAYSYKTLDRSVLGARHLLDSSG